MLKIIFHLFMFCYNFQIADEQEAIAKVASERKGRIPLSVCHQLEQCIREVDVSQDTQICKVIMTGEIYFSD